jgi:hypothetical protein
MFVKHSTPRGCRTSTSRPATSLRFVRETSARDRIRFLAKSPRRVERWDLSTHPTCNTNSDVERGKRRLGCPRPPGRS